MGAFAIPAVPVQALFAPNARLFFGTYYGSEVSGDSFTNTEVPGTQVFSSRLGETNIFLNNVNLNLASSTSFDLKSPPPTSITGTYNYQWDFGDKPTGVGAYAEVALNNNPVNYTPGFDASRSVNQTTFNTSGTQTLTVSVTPRDALPNINLGVRISEDQYVNPTIESVTSPNGAPLYNSSISPNRHEMNIYFDNPTKDTTYTYTITLQLGLKLGVTLLNFMPRVQIGTSQTIASGPATGTSFSGLAKDYSTSPTTVAGTWTWSIDDSITVDWYESFGKLIRFPGYSSPPGPPSVGKITPSTTVPCPVGTSIGISASFTGAVPDGPYNVNINWGDETSSILPSMSTPGQINASHTYLSPGVYTIKVTVTDGHGRVGESSYRYVVIYDPEGGFVTGGGWIISPVGAYTANPDLTDKATFGFVSKYEEGANIPTGNTEFQFNAGNLNFKSTSYDWLVIAGAKAQYRGTGTINGEGNYRFILTVIDGDQLADGKKPDTFRIRIFGFVGLIYDNQLNTPDPSDPTTVLGGGSIVIHK
jgi:hypothetical protein